MRMKQEKISVSCEAGPDQMPSVERGLGLQVGIGWPQLREEQVWQRLQTRLMVPRER